jgi:mannose-1-phosphate guanylyltransferase
MRNLSSLDPSLYAVILAGGFGERFWPLSRQSRPKHHLSLFSSQSQLETTVQRLDGLISNENTIVLTSASQAEAIRKLVPHLPPANIIVEPDRRDTAAAMALAAATVARRDASATAVVLPSDHHIPSPEAFRGTLAKAIQAARNFEQIVTIAIPPTFACTAFGYLEVGASVSPGSPAKQLLKFHEKPEADVAQSYLDQGCFRWNAGMFVWTVSSLRAALQHASPELSVFAEKMLACESPDAFLSSHFAALPKLSFDRAIMEKIPSALAVEAEFDWDDLGGWPATSQYLPQTAGSNASNVPLHQIDASGNVVFSTNPGQQVALLGVSDLIVVNTGDALLVCPKDQSERLRELVNILPHQLR